MIIFQLTFSFVPLNNKIGFTYQMSQRMSPSSHNFQGDRSEMDDSTANMLGRAAAWVSMIPWECKSLGLVSILFRLCSFRITRNFWEVEWPTSFKLKTSKYMLNQKRAQNICCQRFCNVNLFWKVPALIINFQLIKWAWIILQRLYKTTRTSSICQASHMLKYVETRQCERDNILYTFLRVKGHKNGQIQSITTWYATKDVNELKRGVTY
jgi:hypothetical protein